MNLVAIKEEVGDSEVEMEEELVATEVEVVDLEEEMEEEVVEMEEEVVAMEVEMEAVAMEVDLEAVEMEVVVMEEEVVEEMVVVVEEVPKYLAHLLQRSNAFLFLKQTALLFQSNTVPMYLLKSAALALSRNALVFHLLNLKESAEQSPQQTADLSPLKSVFHPQKASAGQFLKVFVSRCPRPHAHQPPRLLMSTLA